MPSGCNVKHFASTIDCACSNNPHNEWLLSDCSNTELLTVELLALFGNHSHIAKMTARGWGRDLLGELEKRNARPTVEEEEHDVESPTKRLRFTADELPLIREYVRLAQFDATAHTCIVVVVDDGFADTILDTGVKDDVVALQAGQGCYSDTKVRLDGKPVWKQVPDAVASPTGPMLWWFSPDASFGGWYCASDVWATEKEQLMLKPLVSYWSRGTDELSMPTPGKIHFPFLGEKR